MTEKFISLAEQYSIIAVFLAVIFILKDPFFKLGVYLIDKKFAELPTLKEIKEVLENKNLNNNVLLLKEIQKIIDNTNV